MNKHFLGRRWQLKPRIFIMLFLLLLVVFASVFIAFNLFINNYIKSSVQNQLDNLVQTFGSPQGLQPGNGTDPFLPDLSRQKKPRFGERGQVLVINSAYEVWTFDKDLSEEEVDEILQMASFLKSTNTDLNEARYLFVKTTNDTYYISSVPDALLPDFYFVFYVSVAGINHLVQTVNLALGAVMILGMLVSFIIANTIASSISTPVKELSGFAEEIGKGNFGQRAFAFQDKEFEELGDAMNLSAERLEAYDKDQRLFFQNVSHELRTPLQAIRSFAEGVELGLMEPKGAGATIVAETDRMSDLVEDLLYISRIDTLNTNLEMEENDLRETLSLCAEHLQPLAEKKKINIIFDFDQKAVLFNYNEKHLYRTFTNLISNALRYAKSEIILTCHQCENGVEISVSDDGPGIAPEDLPHIFERFYKGPKGKHGIGLSIVKSVVELHGGEITVDCENGTSFRIFFPVDRG